MGGFFGWFVVIVGVLAIFNAEKLPELRALFEEKLKDSMDAAKEGSKIAKDKIKQVKTDMENKKTEAAKKDDDDEESPEEIEESLKFMGSFLNKNNKEKEPETTVAAAETKVEPEKKEEPEAEKPIDLEHRD